MTGRSMTRRGAMRAAVGTLATATAGTALAQSEPDYGGWFDNVSNFDGTVDRTGHDTVEITVGAKGNNGNFAFGPAAVRVSPGTKVVWKWTGKGGGHNVVSQGDGPLDSGSPVSAAGTTYSYTFEETGIYKYLCVPHEALGMKGAVVVSESGGSGSGGGGSGGGSGGQSGPPKNPDYGGWFDNVSNFDGTVDRTGQDSVEITVGAKGNNGNFAFAPAAVRVSPGTEVVWKWTGKGGGHNVVSEGDGPLNSGDPVSEAGTTYSYTFEEPGIYKYLCVPHEALGMKGAVVVGSAGGGGGDSGGERVPISPGLGAAGSAILLAFLSPIAFAVFMRNRYPEGRPSAGSGQLERAEQGPPETEEAPVEQPAEELGHEEYDPVGTAGLIVAYFLIITLLWVFMYFVEFLGRVTVIG